MDAHEYLWQPSLRHRRWLRGTQAFFPFGEVRKSTGSFDTQRGFTGQISDSGTGLNFYNARYQDPALGRFVSPDNIVPNPTKPGHFNPFAYVSNNPLGFTDPTGHLGCRPTFNSDLLTGMMSGGCGWDGAAFARAAIIASAFYYLIYDPYDFLYIPFLDLETKHSADLDDEERDKSLLAIDAAMDDGLGSTPANPDPNRFDDDDDDFIGPRLPGGATRWGDPTKAEFTSRAKGQIGDAELRNLNLTENDIRRLVTDPNTQRFVDLRPLNFGNQNFIHTVNGRNLRITFNVDRSSAETSTD